MRISPRCYRAYTNNSRKLQPPAQVNQIRNGGGVVRKNKRVVEKTHLDLLESLTSVYCCCIHFARIQVDKLEKLRRQRNRKED